MSTVTSNYAFVKPALTDAADITATNGNWDKIDQNLKSLENKNTETNTNVTNLDKKVDNQKTELTNTFNSKVSQEVAKLQTKVTSGTSTPSGGNPGDVYIQIIED